VHAAFAAAAEPAPEIKPWRPPGKTPGDEFDAPWLEPAVAAARAAPPPAAEASLGASLREEFAAMRRQIEDQLAQLAWSDSLRRQPVRARFTRELLAAGYSAQLAREITQRVPDDYTVARAQQWLIGVLTRNVRCVAAEEDIVTRGGVYALVGPTGVGKTTTTAKLAARCAVRYGAGKVALLTTDTFRVGAQDQLRIYARILGLAVHTVSDRNDLKQALDSMRGRHLVLIDTVGMGQRDARVAEQSLLLSHPGVQRLLLLNATAQAETLEEVVSAYGETSDSAGAASLAGCILTKIDEAAKTGPALDVLIRHRLALAYVSNGQRVPEDLYAPNAEYLVHRSLRAAAKTTPFTLGDDDFALATATATAGSCHA
jgi:flagellar biosynthesis protein FlhF